MFDFITPQETQHPLAATSHFPQLPPSQEITNLFSVSVNLPDLSIYMWSWLLLLIIVLGFFQTFINI